MYPIPRCSDRLRRAAAWLGERARPARAVVKLARYALVGFVLGHVLFVVVVLVSSVVLLKVTPRHTALMLWRRVTADVHAPAIRFTPIGQIPRTARDMAVRLEDGHFWTHPGISLGAIRDAYLVNRSIGYALYGGSTITQQLARNLFLTPRKTYFRKYLEAIAALCLDLVLPKVRILELYLNVIEWGPGTFGITAAAARAYGVRPSALALDQQRRLIAVLPNPLRYDVATLTANRQLAARYRYLLTRFPDAGGTDVAVSAEGAGAPSTALAETPADQPPVLAGEPVEEGDDLTEPPAAQGSPPAAQGSPLAAQGSPSTESEAAGLRLDTSAPPAAQGSPPAAASAAQGSPPAIAP